jgi:hypothetical protein
LLREIFKPEGDLVIGCWGKLLFNFALEYAIRRVTREPGRAEIEWDTPAFGLF